MLQGTGKEKSVLCLCAIFCLLYIGGCKTDTSTHPEEEATYLADFEAPENKWGYIDTSGSLVIKAIYDDVGVFSEGLAAVNKGGKWGYIDTRGNWAFQPQFKSAWAFHEDFARVEPFGQPPHFISRSGRSIASDQWVAADDFSDGRARVRLGNTFGYIDSTGNLIIQAIYSRGWNFQHGIAIVDFEDKLGVINTAGEEVIPHRFDQIKIGQNDNIILCNGDHLSVVFDFQGKELAKVKETKMIESDGHLISIRQGDKMYFYDLHQKILKTNQAYKNIIYLKTNRWAAKMENLYMLLDEEGNALGTERYTQINRFSDGFAAFCKDSIWGYIDRDGNEVVEAMFGLAWDYKEGLARAAFKDGIAYINLQQDLSFYPPYGTLDMRDYSFGLAPVQMIR